MFTRMINKGLGSFRYFRKRMLAAYWRDPGLAFVVVLILVLNIGWKMVVEPTPADITASEWSEMTVAAMIVWFIFSSAILYPFLNRVTDVGKELNTITSRLNRAWERCLELTDKELVRRYYSELLDDRYDFEEKAISAELEKRIRKELKRRGVLIY